LTLRSDALLPTHQTDARSFAELKASGRWLEAAGIQRAMLQSMLSKGDAKHTDIFDAMYSLVFLYRKAAQCKDAEATISNVKQISKVDDPVRDIQLRLEDARIQQIRGHYHLARSRCQAILATSATQWSSHPELGLEAAVISFECSLALCDSKGELEANQLRTLLDEVMAKHNNDRQNPPQALIDAMTANFKLNILQTLDDEEKQESKEGFELMVVKVQERTLGKHHPDTMTSLCLLGQWLLEQYSHVPAQVQHALQLLEDVRSGLEAILGATHPDTLSAMLRLGIGHVTKGNSSIALAHFRRCYEACHTALGPDHPLTIGSAAQLGSILFRTGRKTEAVQFFQVVANGFPQARCEDVLAAAVFTNVMGEVYIDVGKTSEAMEIYTQFLATRDGFFKSEASPVFRMYHAMGRICMARQSYGEAVNYFQLAYERRLTALGQEHEDVLESARRLAIAHRKNHNETQAAKIFTQIRSNREAQLKRCAEQGRQSLQSLTAEHNLGMALRDLQQFARAESCFNRAYAGRKNVLGRDHFLTLNSKHWADVSRFDSDAIASWVGQKFFGREQAY
jgi:tetratricopeptide (TPR) repeat protein